MDDSSSLMCIHLHSKTFGLINSNLFEQLREQTATFQESGKRSIEGGSGIRDPVQTIRVVSGPCSIHYMGRTP